MRPAVSGTGTLRLTLAWYTLSAVSVTSSRAILQRAPFPLALCTCQFGAASIYQGLLLLLSRTPHALRRRERLHLATVALSYTLGFIFTNIAFSLADAPFVETVKADLTPPYPAHEPPMNRPLPTPPPLSLSLHLQTLSRPTSPTLTNPPMTPRKR